MTETLPRCVATDSHPNLDAIVIEPDNIPFQTQEPEHTVIETPIGEPDLNETATQTNETEHAHTDLQQQDELRHSTRIRRQPTYLKDYHLGLFFNSLNQTSSSGNIPVV